MFAMNRDHYEGTQFDQTKGIASGPYGNPNRYDTGSNGDLTGDEAGAGVFERSISIFRTSHSFVTQARANTPNVAAKVHLSVYSPHAAIYVPIYVSTSTFPKTFETGSLYSFNPKSLFWSSAVIGNYAERAFVPIITDVKAKQNELESFLLKREVDIEKQALEFAREGQPTKALDVLSQFQQSAAEEALSTWHRLFWEIVTKFHDGYRMDDLTARDLSPHKLFYPKWWLEEVGFFKFSNGPGSAPATYTPTKFPGGFGAPSPYAPSSISAVSTSAPVAGPALGLFFFMVAVIFGSLGLCIGSRISRRKSYNSLA